MDTFLSKLKSLAIVLVVLSFFAAATMNSCTSGEQGGGQAETEEHPADSVDEEHPEEEEAE